jgi:hypothetical protein
MYESPGISGGKLKEIAVAVDKKKNSRVLYEFDLQREIGN